MKVGIVGVGVVGGATAKVLEKKHTVLLWDKYKKDCCCEAHFNWLVDNAEVIFICVPTPMDERGFFDDSIIVETVKNISSELKKMRRKNVLLVIKSTTPPDVIKRLKKIASPVEIAVNPEFLRQDYALSDMENTDRVVIGTDSQIAQEKLLIIYESVFPNAQYTLTDTKTAALIKYACNAFLTSQIAIANEMHRICKAAGIDYQKIKEVALQDKRIARNIEVPGPDGELGFGGACFPKDLNTLIHYSSKHNYTPYLLKEVQKLNRSVRRIE